MRINTSLCQHIQNTDHDVGHPTYPVRPVKVYYAGVALALSLVVAAILALLLEYLNFTLETTASAQEALQLPLLASFPHIDA